METPIKLSENLNISHFSVELKYMRGIKERKPFMRVSAHFLEVYCSVLGIDNTPHHLVNFRIKSAEKANSNDLRTATALSVSRKLLGWN